MKLLILAIVLVGMAWPCISFTDDVSSRPNREFWRKHETSRGRSISEDGVGRRQAKSPNMRHGYTRYKVFQGPSQVMDDPSQPRRCRGKRKCVRAGIRTVKSVQKRKGRGPDISMHSQMSEVYNIQPFRLDKTLIRTFFPKLGGETLNFANRFNRRRPRKRLIPRAILKKPPFQMTKSAVHRLYKFQSHMRDPVPLFGRRKTQANVKQSKTRKYKGYDSKTKTGNAKELGSVRVRARKKRGDILNGGDPRSLLDGMMRGRAHKHAPSRTRRSTAGVETGNVKEGRDSLRKQERDMPSRDMGQRPGSNELSPANVELEPQQQEIHTTSQFPAERASQSISTLKTDKQGGNEVTEKERDTKADLSNPAISTVTQNSRDIFKTRNKTRVLTYLTKADNALKQAIKTGSAADESAINSGTEPYESIINTTEDTNDTEANTNVEADGKSINEGTEANENRVNSGKDTKAQAAVSREAVGAKVSPGPRGHSSEAGKVAVKQQEESTAKQDSVTRHRNLYQEMDRVKAQIQFLRERQERLSHSLLAMSSAHQSLRQILKKIISNISSNRGYAIGENAASHVPKDPRNPVSAKSYSRKQVYGASGQLEGQRNSGSVPPKASGASVIWHQSPLAHNLLGAAAPAVPSELGSERLVRQLKDLVTLTKNLQKKMIDLLQAVASDGEIVSMNEQAPSEQFPKQGSDISRQESTGVEPSATLTMRRILSSYVQGAPAQMNPADLSRKRKAEASEILRNWNRDFSTGEVQTPRRVTMTDRQWALREAGILLYRVAQTVYDKELQLAAEENNLRGTDNTSPRRNSRKDTDESTYPEQNLNPSPAHTYMAPASDIADKTAGISRGLNFARKCLNAVREQLDLATKEDMTLMYQAYASCVRHIAHVLMLQSARLSPSPRDLHLQLRRQSPTSGPFELPDNAPLTVSGNVYSVRQVPNLPQTRFQTKREDGRSFFQNILTANHL